jgi:hypothetical protein
LCCALLEVTVLAGNGQTDSSGLDWVRVAERVMSGDCGLCGREREELGCVL